VKRATRAGIHIDRASSAWLIRRFVDPDAEFVFVTDPDDVPADATPFDMRGVAYGHHEAPGLDVALRGLSMTQDDDTVLSLAGPIFDGLFDYYRRSLLLGRDTS
jgi:hypothetical protein